MTTSTHCSAATAAALKALGWEESAGPDVTMFVHDHNQFVEFWDDGRVLIGEFSGQDHWEPIQINDPVWREAWRHIVGEMMG